MLLTIYNELRYFHIYFIVFFYLHKSNIILYCIKHLFHSNLNFLFLRVEHLPKYIFFYICSFFRVSDIVHLSSTNSYFLSFFSSSSTDPLWVSLLRSDFGLQLSPTRFPRISLWNHFSYVCQVWAWKLFLLRRVLLKVGMYCILFYLI